MMRALLVVALSVAALGAGAETRDYTFRVWLDDREIGRHQFVLRGDGGMREVVSKAQFDVRFLFIDAYRYRHEALERWDDRCLRSLVATTDTNGDRQRVVASVRGDGFVVERQEGREAFDGCVMTFAYWNPSILAAKRLLNSQTGEMLPVTVTSRGEEVLQVRGQPQRARRYRIDAAKLQIDLWYVDDRWAGLEAVVSGGRRLRYELL